MAAVEMWIVSTRDEDVARGWEALGLWSEDAARIERLTGGAANDVWSVRVRRQLAIGRLGSRSDADLAWEAGFSDTSTAKA